MTNEQNTITVVDEQGNEILCEILTIVESEEFGKNFVLYSEIGTEDADGLVQIMASSFTPAENGEDGELQPIESEEEWAYLEDILEQLDDEEEE
ncbi:DUF1292 domain-containing protein [Kurthia sibirica]|uniref:UPF0473 protein DEX24_11185 n=1 Tax=Kurthia sibirica TaxID=202750 RepID=A0A2U3AJV6_9BACL|nr:DUF1292 domain-containing protein [Kurthia sibirica]PWI24819.1 hypothetical protein DEX24_11185 [Kurthia sibirica]GEK33335.1 UPF0473 protein YrzB [Kurthia sibirica]